MSLDFRSDPIGQRFKGWKQPPHSPKTRLVPGWEPRPEFGAGQSEDDYMALIAPGGLPPVIEPLVPADREDRLEPYDWAKIREKVFPAGLDQAPAAPPPMVPADREERIPPPRAQKRVEPDPDLAARLGSRPVARKAPDVYDPSQARTLSSSAPTPRPPGGPPTAPTSAQAAAGPGGAGPRSKNQQEFVETLLPKAQAMGRKLGIPWQVLMAIPANETGWGQSVFHNNLFGIKGPGAKAKTWEVINGQRVDITDSFRTFDSPESAMQGFAELMQAPRYSKALSQLQADPSNWPAFVSMIHSAGYATDPQWSQKVIRIGQGLESSASQPTSGTPRVEPSGSLLDTARSPTQAGGVMKPGEGGVIPVVPGGRKDSYWTAGGTHAGGPAADIFAEKGSPIHAPVGGISQPATYSKGGNATTIKGDDGRWYYMAHGNVPFVGGRIEAGQQIGQVGDTGNAKGTNPHLHFAIASDPSVFNKRDGSGDIWGGAEYWGAGGGTTPGKEAGPPYTDSASYVAWTYRNGLGRNVPARASGLYAASKPISATQALPGDLVMFNMNSRDPNQQHVGIYAGNGKMLHNLDGVEETDLWRGAEFRRLSGVKPEDLTRMGKAGTPVQPQSVNRIVKYVDNEDGTYTATHQDGSTTIERAVTQPAPVEGGKHPSRYKTSTVRPRMGGGQEEEPEIEDTTDYPYPAYTPRAAWATNDLPSDPLDPMSDPERRAQALREAGWTEDAIARVRDVPTNVWGGRNPSWPEVAGTYTPGSVGEQLSSGEPAPAAPPSPTRPPPPGRIDIYAPTVSDYGPTVKAGTGEKYTPENVYQHEAHHAIDELTPGVRSRLQAQGISNAADVIEDLNMVRSYAAVHSDRELFEAVNEALWSWRNDPSHINHYMGQLGVLRGTPEWYRERYFGHRAASPDWQGVEPGEAQLSMTDTRTLGQEPPPPREPIVRAREKESLQPEPTFEEMLSRARGKAEGLDTQVGAGQDEYMSTLQEYEQPQPGPVPPVITPLESPVPYEEQIDPLTGRPRGRPAREVVPEAIAAAPQNVGDFFSGLGSAVRQVVEEPEVRASRMAQAEEYDRQKQAAEELARRKRLAPPPEEQPALPPSPVDLRPLAPTTEQFTPPEPTIPPEYAPVPFGHREPGLKPDSAIMRQARGETVNPFDVTEEMGRAAAQIILPKDVREQGVEVPLAGKVTIEDAATQLLRPDVMANLVLGGGPLGARVGGSVIDQAVGLAATKLMSATGKQVAPAVRAVLPAVERAVANAVGDISPQMAERLEQITGPLSRQGVALADALRPLTTTYSNSPLGQFLAAESGQVTTRAALGMAAGPTVGGVTGGLAATAPNLIHPTVDDPGWSARVWDDFWTGARYGGAIGAGTTALGVIGKYGWDKTFGPRVAHAFWNYVEPVRNIPSARAREAMLQRAFNNGGAQASAEVIEEQAYKLFGKPGQGLNTRDAAMYIEENGTLANYRGPNGERPTQKQIEWVDERVADEGRLGNEQRLIGVLGQSQIVSTPLGDPGPTTHVMHTYDIDKKRRGVAPDDPSGLGWRGTVQRARNKTTNPNIDPETPITIREALAEHVNNPKDNPLPTDSMTDRFVKSFHAQEVALANRRAWLAVVDDPEVVWRPARGGHGPTGGRPSPPDDFVRVKEEWRFGRGSENAWVHKDLAAVYNNLTAVSPLRGTVTALRPLRELVFAGAVSHMFNVGWRAMLGAGPFKNAQVGGTAWKAFFNPNSREEFILNNPNLWVAAHQAGVTPGAVTADIYGRASNIWGVLGQMGASTLFTGLGGFGQAKLRGESDEDALRAAFTWAAVGGFLGAPGPGAAIARSERKGLSEEWHRSLIALSQEAVFDRALPLAKVTLWSTLTRAGVAPGAAAELANNTIGGLNTVKMARAPWFQDLLRVGFMAPDWFESQIRQVGSLFVPGEVGAYSRRTILGNAIAYGAFVEALNVAFNGHPTWENEKGYETTFETTGMLDKLGQITGQDLVQRHPESGVVQRTYADWFPNLRWVLNIVGEAARSGEEHFGSLMGATGEQELGGRVRGMARGNLGEGEVPPSMAGEVGKVLSNRANQMFRVGGNVAGMIQGEQADWNEKRYEMPHYESNDNLWGKVLKLARATEGLAPAELQSAQRTVNVLHPERSQWVDTAIESLLGITRTGRTTEQGVRLRQQDDVYRHLGFSLSSAQQIETDFRDAIDQNSEARADILNSLGTGGSRAKMTHAEAAEELSDLAAARTENSRYNQIERTYVKKAPESLQDQVRTFLNSVYKVGDQGSLYSTDVPEDTDLDTIWQQYWNPPDADPLNREEMKRAQRRVLVEAALSLGVDSEALLDEMKWRAQSAGALGAQTPHMPSLPGVTSGQFDVAIEGFLKAGTDPKTGKRIEDDDIRSDKQRQALKASAAEMGVDHRTLLKRINLRLSPAAQLTAREANYQTALQTLYESYDSEQFPRYMDENGKALGREEDWEGNDLLIGALGMARAKQTPELMNLALAKERGQNAREKWLMSRDNPGSTAFDRWYGTGREMTEPQWVEYAAGRTVGYEDLVFDRGLLPPRDETIRRDKIQKLYRASNMDERIDTDVEVWINGGYVRMPLIAANNYIRHFMVNTPGRKLDYLAAHDEPSPGARPSLFGTSTVAANKEEE